MADEIDDDAGWPNEEINQAVTSTIELILSDAKWDEKMVPTWINEIVEKSMKALVDMKLPYKFIVTCMLIQKTEKPICSSFSVNWENNNDGIENIIYPPLRQKDSYDKTIACLATVMGVKF